VPEPTEVTPPEPAKTEKERAAELRRRMATPPRTRIVTVEQTMGEAPKGIRFIMEVDTASRAFNITIQPDSAEGMIAFLEQIRFVANKVGVDYEIKRLKVEDLPQPGAKFL
jgi:hypothetical protein